MFAKTTSKMSREKIAACVLSSKALSNAAYPAGLSKLVKWNFLHSGTICGEINYIFYFLETNHEA